MGRLVPKIEGKEMRRTKHVLSLLALSVLALNSLGCGGGPGVELGEVYGRVTLDGKPLAGVHVYFRAKGGRPSVGIVDDEGYYEAVYTAGVEGVRVGPCTVSIAWPTGKSGPPIPAEYAQMKREVKEGKNEFDFELKSK